MMNPAEHHEKPQRRATGQRRGRGRSPSRDTPRSDVHFPRRESPPRDDYSNNINNDSNSNVSDNVNKHTGVSSRRCNCECCCCSSPPPETDRDWSIRFPGMTREQFDDMMIFLDDPDLMSVGGSYDCDDSMDDFSTMRDDGVTYSPVEMPDVVPASPSELQQSQYFSDGSIYTREEGEDSDSSSSSSDT